MGKKVVRFWRAAGNIDQPPTEWTRCLINALNGQVYLIKVDLFQKAFLDRDIHRPSQDATIPRKNRGKGEDVERANIINSKENENE